MLKIDNNKTVKLGDLPHRRRWTMTALTRLPTELASKFLLTWVDLEDIGHLDSALCNKTERAGYLSLISNASFVISKRFEPREGNAGGILVRSFTSWFLLRGVAVTHISVNAAWVANPGHSRNYLHLHRGHIRNVTVEMDSSLPFEFEAALKEICEHCPHVAKLDTGRGVTISAVTLSHIAHHWPQLTHLAIQVDGIGDGDEFVSVCVECQSLIELTLWTAPPAPALTKALQVCSVQLQKFTAFAPLKPSDYRSLAQRCPLLREVDIPHSKLDDAGLEALAANCVHLEVLKLEKNTKVTNKGLVAVARNRALTTLCLDGCPNITDAGLQAVAQNCPLLERVDLSHSSAVTDATLIAVGQTSHHLRELSLRAVSVTHAGLQAVAVGCPQLQVMRAPECDVGRAVEAVARGCTQLRVLASPHADVPAAAVRALAECCPLLTTAELWGEEIGDAEIAALVAGCPLLTRLYVCGTSATEKGLSAIREHCKHLAEVEVDESMYPDGAYDQSYFSSAVAVEVHSW
jgi:hypothetical protein